MFGVNNGGSSTNIDNELSKGNDKNNGKLIKILIILVAAIIIFFAIFYFVTSMGKNNNSGKVEYFLTLNGNEELIIYKNTEYIDEGAYAYDSNGNKYDDEISITGMINTSVVGEYNLTYSFKDITVSRKVNVVNADSTHYTYLILNGDTQIDLKVGDSYSEPGYNVLDSDDVNLINSVKITGSVDTNKVGTYKIIYSVKNSENITVTAERTIVVKK